MLCEVIFSVKTGFFFCKLLLLKEEKEMKKQVIYVYGTSGSGTSTFSRYLAEQLHYFFMDIDDYFGTQQVLPIRANAVLLIG